MSTPVFRSLPIPSQGRPRGPWVPALAFGLLAGCYSADFDPDADEVFACSVDEDCGEAATCEEQVCINNVGPSLEITGPERLSAVDVGATNFDLVVRGSGLTLVDPGEPVVEGEGYLEVSIDDLLVLSRAEQTQISSGELSTGVRVEGLMIPDLSRRVHRVEVRAYRADGTRYRNRSARGRSLFFANEADPVFDDNNGLRPQIAVLEPWPGDAYPNDQDITVAVAAVNFDWQNPVASGAQKEAPDAPKVGHTHIYFNLDGTGSSGAEYPDCLPACNLQYVTTFNPDSGGTDNSQVLAGPVRLAQEFAQRDALDIRVGLKWNDHVPYPAPNNLDDEAWDLPTRDAGTINARELFVTDRIVVDLFEP